jgi:hypothetical protein
MIHLLLAYQDGTETAAEGTAGGFLTLVVYAVVIGGLFYFLMIRPQRNRMKRHEQLVDSLSVGDEVTTIGGIFGTTTPNHSCPAVPRSSRFSSPSPSHGGHWPSPR